MKETNKTGAVMKFVDEMPAMKGILRYTVFKNGVPIETVEDHNLIVNGARVQMAHLVAGDFEGRNVTSIAFGTNGTAPTIADTSITSPFIKPIHGISYPEMGQVQFDWILEVTEDNGQAILEFGLITEDATLFSRRVRENEKPIYKEGDISIEGQWIIIY